MKRGEADNIGRQPAIGTVRVDAGGRRWVKRRRVSPDAYRKQLAMAIFAARFGTPVDEDVRAMGFELEDDDANAEE